MAVRTATFPGQARPRTATIPPQGAIVRRARLFATDFAVVLAVIGVYFLLRGAAPDRTGAAVELTTWLIAIEKALGIYVEPAIQEASLQSHLVKEAANFVYAYMHFPVLAVVALWLRARDRSRFRFVRNVMFVSMAMGLVFYYLAPAAPPRLMAAHGHDLGFVDTVFGTETAVSYAQPSLIVNEYAAIPSFHFGWIALASAAIWINTGSRILRVLAVALTVVMTWAIVASANHLIIDMVLGGVVIAASWRIALRWEPRSAAIISPISMWARRERDAAA